MFNSHHARQNFTGLLALTVFATFVTNANAGTVTKVKGAAAIVTFDAADGTPKAGDKFFAIENGKKKAVLEVVQFKGGKAKVKILKGNAAEGMTTAVAGKPKAAVAATSADPDGDAADAAESGAHNSRKARSAGGAAVFHDMTVGFVGGYAMDTQTVTSSGTTYSMAGTGYSAKAFVDIPVTHSLGLLSRLGADQFNVQTGTVKTEIMYASVDLILKYAFTEGTFVTFGMGGLGLHFPISKTSNILDVNRISSTTVFYAGGGFNWLLGGSTYMQMTAEYGMFPPSNEVTTSFIAARAGLGFRF